LLLRRSAIDQIGGFHESLCGAADWDFFLRLTSRFDVLHLPGVAASRYIKHEIGMSNDATHMNHDFMLALAHVLEVIERDGDVPEEDRAHVRQQLRRHQFDWGYHAYAAGHLHEARRRFAAAVRESGPSVKAVAYLALSCAPPQVVAKVRRL